jgi:hypothetical protein
MVLRHKSYILHISNNSHIIIDSLYVSNDLSMIKVIDWQTEITLFDNL